MANYIILNGTNSNTINGLLIQELSPISKPAIRTQVEEIDGRDGDIVTKLGYSAYDKEITIGLYGDYDINEVISFFNSEGVVTFSNEPDKYYNYQILNQIDFDRLVRYRTATVTMHCQPFKYSVNEEEIALNGTIITGEGTNLNLINTEEDGAFTDLELKGDTFQQTYSGKNLFDKNAITSGYYVDKNNGELVASQYNNVSTFIKLNSNSVVISGGNNNSFYALYDNNKSYISGGNYINGTAINTTNAQYIRFTLLSTNDMSTTQLEEGTTATDYEPYIGTTPNPNYPQTVQTVTGNNSVLICGKNLFDYNDIVSSANYTNNYDGSFVRNSDGRSITINCNSASQPYNVFKLKRGTYSVSFDILLTGAMTIGNVNVQTYQNGTLVSITKTLGISIPANISTHIKLDNCVIENDAEAVGIASFLTPSGTNVGITISNIQIEVGSTATDYETYESQTYPINLGTIELCRIGDSQDYIYEDNGTWYKHSEIGKLVLDNTQNWQKVDGAALTTYRLDNVIQAQRTDITHLYYCSHFTPIATNDRYIDDTIFINSSSRIAITYTKQTSVADFKTWLGNNKPILYYVLATPTETEISDSTLISQLNALYSSTTYLGVTNIITSGSDLQPIIYVQTYAVENPVVNVTNNGNIYSKPSITIYGQGNIELYLNGSQVFSIALGNEEYITIDVANMEATQDGVLKNRLVTGDYDNFVLQPGENEITFTGALYSMTIENYSRWV